MIDFNNIDKIPKRIVKHTVREGDFYTLSMTCMEKEKLHEKFKDKGDDEMIVEILSKVLCDEKGNLLKLSLKQLKSLPDALFRDIVTSCMGVLTGEKKS